MSQSEASQFNSEISRLEAELSSSHSLARETQVRLETSLETLRVKAEAMEASLLVAQSRLDESLVARSQVESQLVASLSSYQVKSVKSVNIPYLPLPVMSCQVTPLTNLCPISHWWLRSRVLSTGLPSRRCSSRGSRSTWTGLRGRLRRPGN